MIKNILVTRVIVLAIIFSAVFAMSALFVVADSDSGSSDASESNDVSETRSDARTRTNTGRTSVRERFKENHDSIVKEFREERKDDFNRIKADAKERFQERKDKLRESRDSFKERRRMLVEGTVEEKSRLLMELKQNARMLSKDGASGAIAHLVKVRDRLAEAILDEDRRDEILARFDERIKAIAGAEEVVDNLADDSDADAVKEASELVRSSVKEARHVVREERFTIVSRRLGNIIVKAERLQERVASVVSTNNDERLDGLVTEFKQHVSSAKSLHVEAIALFDDRDGNPDKVKEAISKFKEAKKEIKHARKTLKNIIRIIRGQEVVAGTVEEEINDEAEDIDDGSGGDES